MGTSTGQKFRLTWERQNQYKGRTAKDILIRKLLVLGNIARYVRFQKERKQVTSAHVLLLNAAARLLALRDLLHDRSLLLCNELEADPPHDCLRFIDAPCARIRL